MQGMSDNQDRTHVLAMDHSWEVLDLVSDVLQEAGFRVTTRLLAGETVERVASLAPDIIVMDCMYAREDHGRDLFEALIRDARTASLPIVLCTGAVPETEEIRESLDQLGVRIVYKPFDIDDLVGAVRDSLRKV